MLVVQPAPNVVLRPAPGGIAVNNDLHKAPQDSGCLSAGSSIFRGKQAAALAVHDACLLHRLYSLLHAAGNLVAVREKLRFTGHREGVPHLIRVPLHNNRHLFACDGGVRCKGRFTGSGDNPLGGRPLHIGA